MSTGSPFLASPAADRAGLGAMGLVPSSPPAWEREGISDALSVELMDRRMMWVLTPSSLSDVLWERF